MKRMRIGRWLPAALLLAAGGTAGRAEEFAIRSFDGTGRLTYGTLSDGTNHRWEWCLDRYGTYSGFVSDPKGASSGSGRVLRSGSWFNRADCSRSAFRFYDAPDGVHNSVGFRVAMPFGQQ